MSLQDLKSVRSHQVNRFTLEGLKTEAKVISVHDGDTLDVVFYIYDDKLVRFTCRLLGYDAPELKKKKPSQAALLTRDYLAELCVGRDPDHFDDSRTWGKVDLQKLLDDNENLVYVIFDEFGPFGRALVNIKTSSTGKSINVMMRHYVDKINKRY